MSVIPMSKQLLKGWDKKSHLDDGSFLYYLSINKLIDLNKKIIQVCLFSYSSLQSEQNDSIQGLFNIE